MAIWRDLIKSLQKDLLRRTRRRRELPLTTLNAPVKRTVRNGLEGPYQPDAEPSRAYSGLEMRILVVEDERTLASFIEQSLRAEGHAVTVCCDGPSGEAAALTGDYALVLLDLTLPGRDGLEVLGSIRARLPELPVIVLTARAAIEQKVQGLDRGANDYMTKPFSFEELLARVRAQLRAPAQREASVLDAADIAMDLRTRRVRRDGREVALTAREFELLEYLMRHPDQVLSREQILNAVWGFDFDPGTKVLEVYVGYLRRKLGDAAESDPIETVRNVGYRLRVPRD